MGRQSKLNLIYCTPTSHWITLHSLVCVCPLSFQPNTTAAVFDESHLPPQRRNRLFSRNHWRTVAYVGLCDTGWWEKVKIILFSGWTRRCDHDSVWGRCNLKRSSTSAEDYNFQGWTYNLIRWRGAGDVTFDLPSLPSDSVLNRITGDDRGAWTGEIAQGREREGYMHREEDYYNEEKLSFIKKKSYSFVELRENPKKQMRIFFSYIVSAIRGHCLAQIIALLRKEEVYSPVLIHPIDSSSTSIPLYFRLHW